MPRYLAAIALCAIELAAIGQVPAPDAILRDRLHPDHFYQTKVVDGILTLASAENGRGAVSGVRYKTSSGLTCEIFVAEGMLHDGRVRHPWLHPHTPRLAIPNPMPKTCPVIASR